MSKLIVGNWKMHFNPSEASVLVHHLAEKIEASKNAEIVFCPPFIDLYPVSREIDTKKFSLGSQNIHYLDEGPFTGEISPAMLKGLVQYAIIGHSERRQNAAEDDKLISKKVAASIRNDITPILCVGDTLMDREHGVADKVVTDQVTADLSMVTAEEIPDIVIAYEPVWAIGTGNFAKPEQVTPMVNAIRQTVEGMFGEGTGHAFRLLYGGSVVPDNAKTYLTLDGIDGLLVGGASLNYEEFSSIVKTAQQL